MARPADSRRRIVQWGTGNVGRRALPAILDHPEMSLVGLHALGQDKWGMDAGTLVGRAPTGVVATNDVDALLALRPDCLSYMPARIDYETVCGFLRCGVNVVTTGDILTGTNHPPGVTAELRAAALAGNATFLGTGFEPGFANVLAGFLTGACRIVRSVTLTETLDCTTYPVAEAWRAMGFGHPVGERISPIPLSPDLPGLAYFDTLDLIAGMLEVELDTKEGLVERAIAVRDLDLGWMRFPEGSVAGQRRTYRGLLEGEPVVTLAICWTMSDDGLDPQWSGEEGFRIEIEGEPRVDASVRFGLPLTPGLSDEPDVMGVLMVGTAMAAVHAIPFVCQAAPGLITPADLPIYGARHSVI
ncbi:MAG: NAD(P)H-dependent amine dehydrogenase family protein [Acidimicrobiales bacterium]